MCGFEGLRRDLAEVAGYVCSSIVRMRTRYDRSRSLGSRRHFCANTSSGERGCLLKEMRLPMRSPEA